MNYQNPSFAGATMGAWLMPIKQQDSIINEIKIYVSNVGLNFHNILRLNQNNSRYTYLTFIKSDPLKQSRKYQDSFVIGLFYEDLLPEYSIRFKQDFVVGIGSEYKFVIGDTWFELFPELKKYSDQYLWNFKKFDGEIANGKHYQNDGQFNHHYKSVDDLPLEIAKHYTRNITRPNN